MKYISPITQQILDACGSPVLGGRLYVYLHGTTEKATTWRDADGSVTNPNPIVLDARGAFKCFVDSDVSLDYVVKNVFGNVETSFIGVMVSSFKGDVAFHHTMNEVSVSGRNADVRISDSRVTKVDVGSEVYNINFIADESANGFTTKGQAVFSVPDESSLAYIHAYRIVGDGYEPVEILGYEPPFERGKTYLLEIVGPVARITFMDYVPPEPPGPTPEEHESWLLPDESGAWLWPDGTTIRIK